VNNNFPDCVSQLAIRIKTNKNNTKFKVRCSKYLYSLTLKEADKISKLKQSLPPHLNIEQITKKKIKPAKK
jgi:large subunit ribosomal protein L38e